jgi:hypothetical protein
MKTKKAVLNLALLVFVAGLGAPSATAQQTLTTKGGEEVEVPQATVPGIFTMQGQFTRIAYNNEGWVTLGYREANSSQGSDWLMLEVGLTLRAPAPNYTMTRDKLSIKLPDGTMVPLATQKEYAQAGYLRALNARADAIRDSINYFPIEAKQGLCSIGFFSDPTSKMRSISYDQVELSYRRACMGRLFFKLPEGKTIVPGQYWLYTDFAKSQVQTPFRIVTKDEEKFLKKNWKDLKKQYEAFLKQEAEKAKQAAEKPQQ